LALIVGTQEEERSMSLTEHYGRWLFIVVILGLAVGVIAGAATGQVRSASALPTPTLRTLGGPTPTPGAAGGTISPGQGGQQRGAGGFTGGQGGPFARGTISKIEGTTLTVTTAQGSSVTVRLTDKTTYQQSMTISLADVKTGDPVLVAGREQQDKSIAAVSITVSGALGSEPGFGQARSLTGTVQTIEGQTITMQTATGPIKVSVGEQTQLRKVVAATQADLKAGDTVTITGQTDTTGVLVATTVVIQR